MLKDARVGGPFQWHQDFGYWYHNSVPGPDMLSVMVALDTHTRENGCLVSADRTCYHELQGAALLPRESVARRRCFGAPTRWAGWTW